MHLFNGAFSVVYFVLLLTASVLDIIRNKPAESWIQSMNTAPVEPTIHRVHISQGGKFYLHQEKVTKDIPQDSFLDHLRGAIIDIEPYVTTKDTFFKPAGSVMLKVLALPEDQRVEGEAWQLELPCTYFKKDTGRWDRFVQCHYRSMLDKLQNVDLTARAVTLRPKAGDRATFINVFLDDQCRIPVTGGSIPKGQEAFEEAVNSIRAGLGLPPLNPEWLTPQKREDYSQTASQVIDLESLPNE